MVRDGAVNCGHLQWDAADLTRFGWLVKDGWGSDVPGWKCMHGILARFSGPLIRAETPTRYAQDVHKRIYERDVCEHSCQEQRRMHASQ